MAQNRFTVSIKVK